MSLTGAENLSTRAAGELLHTALCTAFTQTFYTQYFQAGVCARHVLPPSYLAVIIVIRFTPCQSPQA
jgi:hypothetical protein